MSKIQWERIKKVKTEDFAKSFASNSINNNSKKPMSYRSYTDKQIINFISLIIKMDPVKVAVVRTGITLPTAYQFQKMVEWKSKETEVITQWVMRMDGFLTIWMLLHHF